MAVDIGEEATNRPYYFSALQTQVNKAAVASMAGTVTSIDIWANVDMTGLKVGIFYFTNGGTLRCRSAASIDGTITNGSKVNKVVSLAVAIGDVIGCYYATGRIERDANDFQDVLIAGGDHCIVDDEAEYETSANDAISLGGYITGLAAGRSFGFIIG